MSLSLCHSVFKSVKSKAINKHIYITLEIKKINIAFVQAKLDA